MRLKIYIGMAVLVCACSDVGTPKLRGQTARAAQEQATTDAAAPARKVPVEIIDPTQVAALPWDLCCEMWESSGEFVIDGNLKSVG
jgi:hypothetical protein